MMDDNRTPEMKTLTFSIEGETITQLAREKYTVNADLKKAINLLMGCLETDQVTIEQRLLWSLLILNKKARIKGTYPHEDYGLEINPEYEDANLLDELFEVIAPITSKIDDFKNKYENLLQKYEFVLDYLELSDYKRKKIDRDYYEEYDEHIFEFDDEENDNNIGCSSLLSSYLERQRNQVDGEEDYGWLEPNGTFHPVAWGDHQEWAQTYIKEHCSEEEWSEAGLSQDFSTGIACINTFGDYLVKRGWVLLHNPAQGMVTSPTKHPTKDYTKAQREFLYDYYIKRNQTQLANKLYQEK